MVKQSHFSGIAKQFVNLTPNLLNSLSEHLEHGKSLINLEPAQKHALELLHQINIISAHIPGSEASKIQVCNKIRSYFGLFGLPHIYLTLNPCAAHSPIFQVMFGDKNVNLSEQYPILVNAIERALQDPVAASDFFEFQFMLFVTIYLAGICEGNTAMKPL